MPEGTIDPRGGEDGRRAHPALLLPPGTSGRRRVPHVPRRSREGAEARALLRDVGRRRAGGARALARRRSRRGRACSRCCSSTIRSTARSATSPASASCRTTRTRKGARIRATASRSASIRSRISAATSLYVAEPLHSLHALRALHGRRRARPGAQRQRARRPRAHRQVRGTGPDASVGGNVVDLCPVGALLSKDFLNKARAWELDRTASVCPNCSQGCNMIVETRDNVVVRLRPRPNEDVNKYFMCDHGRLELPLDEPAGPRRAADGPRRRCARARRTGKSRSRSRGVAASASKRVRARVAECSRTRRSSCSPQLIEHDGGQGAFRVRAGRRGAAAGRRGSRAAPRPRGQRRRRRAARLHARPTRR